MLRRIASYALAILLVPLPGPAEAAFEGRAPSADVVRLAAYGQGHIDGAGPGLDVAAGAEGAFGFGRAGCDDAGYGYRVVVHSNPVLEVTVPDDAKRMDLILRPVRGLRDLTVKLGDRDVASTSLERGWQRVSVPLEGGDAGRRALELSFSRAVGMVEEGPDMPREARALLHAILFNEREEAPTGDPGGPLAASDVLWLEPGLEVAIPAPLQRDQALETLGLVTRGETSDLRVTVELVTAQGAVNPIFSIPATLEHLPWNLDLSRGGRRSPVHLRFRVDGEGEGAVGLRRPVLTVPADGASGGAEDGAPSTKKLVLVGVRGLRADRVAGAFPGAVQMSNAWSPSPRTRSALASLWTGRYPASHGLRARTDRLADGIPTLAETLAEAGWRTILRTGLVPVDGESPVARGFADVEAAGSGGFLPHAELVLGELAEALLGADEEQVFAAAVLGDTGPPWIPRGEAWKAHWGGRGDPPWNPARNREVLQRVRTGERTLDQRDRAFLDVLARGKSDELLEALGTFIERVRKDAPDAVVIIAGLGGGVLEGDLELTPATARVPVWLVGADLPAPDAAVDLTDVAPTVLELAGVDAPAGIQGLGLLAVGARTWPTFAVSSGSEVDLVAQEDLAGLVPRGDGSVRWKVRREGRWEATDPTSADAIRATLVERELRGWRGAGARWDERDFSPAMTREGRAGYESACDR